jgi:hypothetical protein
MRDSQHQGSRLGNVFLKLVGDFGSLRLVAHLTMQCRIGKMRLSKDCTQTYGARSPAVDHRHKRRREHRQDAYSDNTIASRLHLSTSRVRQYTRPVDLRSEYPAVTLRRFTIRQVRILTCCLMVII